jgi:hypothetical protein
MGFAILEWPDKVERFTVKNYTSAAVGDVVGKTHDALVATKTEVPTCILVEVPSVKYPQRNLVGLANGALLDMNGATSWGIGAQNPGTLIYSNGDGTLTATKPTGSGADSVYWAVGYVEQNKLAAATSDNLRIKIVPIRGVS